MKTAKKLFSLLLVAVLLMSAIPFQASASSVTPPPATPTITYKIIFRAAAGSTEKAGEAFIDSATNLMTGTVPTITSATHNHIGWDIDGQVTTNNVQAESFAPNRFTWRTSLQDENLKYLNLYPIMQPKAHAHAYDEGTITQPATCTTAGVRTRTCTSKVGTCDVPTITESIPVVAHTFGAWQTTTPATTEAKGLQTRTCIHCPETETQDIAQLAVHVSFVDNEGGRPTQYRDYVKGQPVSNLPPLTDLPGRSFAGWFTRDAASGTQILNGNEYTGVETYYARYIDNSDSNAVEVTVYARFFSGNVKQFDYPLGKLTLQKSDVLLDHLTANREDFTDRIFAFYDAAEYEARPGFYMNTNNSPVTTSTQLVNGNTSVYIRVNAKNAAEANVLLYVHNKLGESAVRLFDMPGYVAGNTVNTTAVQNFLKAQTGKSYTVTGMYDDAAWNQVLVGRSPDAVTSIDVPGNGTLKLHVVLSNYSSSSSVASKPASNPSTGDPIMATAGIMVLAAAALVSILELRKRKMI